LLDAMKQSRNGRRLLAMPGLREDVWFSVQRETVSFTAQMSKEGVVRKTALNTATPDSLL